MTTTIKERRQRTLEAMRAAGPEHFEMSSWFQRYSEGYGHPISVELAGYKNVNIEDCGTTACLAGFIAVANQKDEDFPAIQSFDGLTYDISKFVGIHRCWFSLTDWQDWIFPYLGMSFDSEEDDKVWFWTNDDGTLEYNEPQTSAQTAAVWLFACELMAWLVDHPTRSDFPSEAEFIAWSTK